jgi:quinol-cytochrome oxidoreductase complex cytochrome b subunit
MSFWGATVITNLFSAFPIIGDHIVTWLWGGFSVDNPTLNRFFALHYLLPFVILGVVFLHVWALHVTGSNNPLGIDVKGPQDTVAFHPYYTMKDTFGLCVFLLAYVAVSFFAPNILAHPDHFVEYDSMVTPAHIVPEWYFLPFYATLRSITFGVNPYVGLALVLFIAGLIPVYGHRKTDCDVVNLLRPKKALLFIAAAVIFALGYASQYELPSGGHMLNLPLATLVFVNAKLGGVLAMFGSVAVLFVLPWLDTHPVRSAMFRPLFRAALLALVVDFVILGWIGAQVPTNMLTIVGQIGTGYYLGFFLVILPVLSYTEKALPQPESINESVLRHSQAKAMLSETSR